MMNEILKIYSKGKVLNESLYNQLKVLDKVNPNFKGCGDEFLPNRDWWVIVRRKKIVAYCGSIYRQGICIFNRAWVHKSMRGQGIQKKFIRLRLRAAKNHIVITYVTKDNYISANNLIECGFRLYLPEYTYGGQEMLYFMKIKRKK
jgi:GNAT superfamily N-acetyltransferase